MAISRADARARRLVETQRAAHDAALQQQAKADAFVQQFIGMTPAQIEAWIDANVTTVAGARSLFKKMALMLLLLARDRYRD
jgi:hypothetical protein